MQMPTWKKVALGSLGTLVLGAFGSGLWELAFRPLGQWLGNGVLTAATLGSSFLRDQVYVEAAKGHHEASALQSSQILCFLFLMLCAALIGAALGIRSASKLPKKSGTDEERQAEITARIGRGRVLNERLGRSTAVLAVCLVFLAGNFWVEYLRANAASDACTFFMQSMAICRPYMDDHESKMLESRFAEIHGRADYISVTDDLRRIASSKQIRLPEFNPW
jgi:hypothetical protein